MAATPFQRRVIGMIVLGIALPAIVLAGLGVYLTLRISSAVKDDSVRYNTYLAQQVVEAYEQELMAHLRGSLGLAETAARNGADPIELLAALDAGSQEFRSPYLVPIDELNGYSMIMVESQPLLYAPGEGARRGQYFVGLLLRGPRNDVLGAGGWWIDSNRFLASHLGDVVRERLPSNPRLYGGYESTRRLSVELLAPNGRSIGRVRDPIELETARTENLQGPFEGFAVRIAATSASPVVWTGRFVTIEIGLILLMSLVLVAATVFGLRYTVRQLELAQLKSGFVSNVTHELKTPIALIRLAVETLEMKRVSSPAESERFLRTIGRETIRLSQLVDNILDFARLEAGQRVFKFEPVDLGQVAREAIESFRPRFDHLGFAVEVDLPEDLPPVRGDATALTHCVLNLLDNAIKYSKGRREVRIDATVQGDRVRLSVADRGIGIAPADQRRIFEKFVRVETGLVHDVKGAGLGLSLVNQIVRAHGGQIDVVSNLNEGSTFTLALPIARGASTPAAEIDERTGS